MPKRANIADAVLRLSKAIGKPQDASRCLKVIAASLEQDGDSAGASLIRERSSQVDKGFLQIGGQAPKEYVDWYEPESPLQPICLDGELEVGINLLRQDLECSAALLEAGVDAPNRILFAGPSGTGKTLAARWLGRWLGLPVSIARIENVVASYIGETAKNLGRILDEAAASPCILFLDEIDGLCGARGRSGEAAAIEMGRTTSALLQRLDNLPPEQIVIAATNLPEHVDTAILRRLPVRLDFPMPTKLARTAMVEAWLRKADVPANIKRQIVDRSEGLSGAALRAMAMQEARAIVLKRAVAKNTQLSLVDVTERSLVQGAGP